MLEADKKIMNSMRKHADSNVGMFQKGLTFMIMRVERGLERGGH